jgi:hypothetical protein
MQQGSGMLVNGFHGDAARGNSFWVYDASQTLVTTQWDTHLPAEAFCKNAIFVTKEGNNN